LARVGGNIEVSKARALWVWNPSFFIKKQYWFIEVYELVFWETR
jgi:hypothetical protein